MDGVHDLGGMHGFGPVVREAHEPVFHARWEGRILAISRSCIRSGLFSLDELRHAIERLPPAVYLGSSYYERWTAAITGLLIEKGALRSRDLAGPTPIALVRISPHAVKPTLAGRGTVSHRPQARFRPGDAVLARNLHPPGHTRIPRYARGKRGTIASDEGAFVLPDSHVHRGRRILQHVYSVRFAARELWGAQAPARSFVYLDLWEDYLEASRDGRGRRAARRSNNGRRSS